MKRSKICQFLPFFLLMVSTSVFAQQTPHYNTRIGSKIMGFYDYLPPGYKENPTKKYPLYIVLQGKSQLGNGSPEQLPWLLGAWGTPPYLINQGKWPGTFTSNGQTFGMIVFTPQYSSDFGANDIKDALDYCLSHYRVDESRIYLSGISLGGGALWDYLSSSVDYAKKIAAAVPISGSSGPSQTRANTIANAGVPIWATTASKDPVVSPNNTIGWVQDINQSPTPPDPRAKLTVFQVDEPTHSEATATTYSLSFKENGLNVYEWMLLYSRSAVLPVTGFELHAILTSNGSVKLNWETESELNNKGFEIEKSSGGQEFSSIGFIKTSSENGKGASYHFEDLSPYAGNNYYRIKQIDKDGKSQYSNVEYVENKTSSVDFQIYPNPASDILNIKFQKAVSNGKLLIRNVNGQLVKESSLNGIGNKQLSISDLPGGYYSIQIIDGSEKYEKTFIKK